MSNGRENVLLWSIAGGLLLAAGVVVVVAMRPSEADEDVAASREEPSTQEPPAEPELLTPVTLQRAPVPVAEPPAALEAPDEAPTAAAPSDTTAGDTAANDTAADETAANDTAASDTAAPSDTPAAGIVNVSPTVRALPRMPPAVAALRGYRPTVPIERLLEAPRAGALGRAERGTTAPPARP